MQAVLDQPPPMRSGVRKGAQLRGGSGERNMGGFGGGYMQMGGMGNMGFGMSREVASLGLMTPGVHPARLGLPTPPRNKDKDVQFLRFLFYLLVSCSFPSQHFHTKSCLFRNN